MANTLETSQPNSETHSGISQKLAAAKEYCRATFDKLSISPEAYTKMRRVALRLGIGVGLTLAAYCADQPAVRAQSLDGKVPVSTPSLEKTPTPDAPTTVVAEATTEDAMDSISVGAAVERIGNSNSHDVSLFFGPEFAESKKELLQDAEYSVVSVVIESNVLIDAVHIPLSSLFGSDIGLGAETLDIPLDSGETGATLTGDMIVAQLERALAAKKITLSDEGKQVLLESLEISASTLGGEKGRTNTLGIRVNLPTEPVFFQAANGASIPAGTYIATPGQKFFDNATMSIDSAGEQLTSGVKINVESVRVANPDTGESFEDTDVNEQQQQANTSGATPTQPASRAVPVTPTPDGTTTVSSVTTPTNPSGEKVIIAGASGRNTSRVVPVTPGASTTVKSESGGQVIASNPVTPEATQVTTSTVDSAIEESDDQPKVLVIKPDGTKVYMTQAEADSQAEALGGPPQFEMPDSWTKEWEATDEIPLRAWWDDMTTKGYITIDSVAKQYGGEQLAQLRNYIDTTKMVPNDPESYKREETFIMGCESFLRQVESLSDGHITISSQAYEQIPGGARDCQLFNY